MMPGEHFHNTEVKNRSTPERRAMLQRVRVEKKLVGARAAARVEEMLEQAGDTVRAVDETIVAQLLNVDTQAFSLIEKQKLEALAAAYAAYRTAQTERTEDENVLRAEIKSTEKKYTPAALGALIFHKETGSDPVGVIHAQRKEAYFVLNFESGEDISMFWKNADQKDRTQEITAKQSLGLVKDEFIARVEDGSNASVATSFLTDQKDVASEPVRAGGAYDVYRFINRPKGVPCITILGLDSFGDEVNKVFRHERRHFINNYLLDTFGNLELSSALSVDFAKKFPALTSATIDEKPRVPTNEKYEAHAQYLYDMLRVYFTDEELGEITEVMTEIETAFEQTRRIFGPNFNAPLLIALIDDVPLVRIAPWLAAINEYFGHQVKEKIPAVMVPMVSGLEDYIRIIDNPDASQKQHIIIPPGLRASGADPVELYRMAQRMRTAIFSLEDAKKSNETLSLLQHDAQELLEKINVNAVFKGVCPPVALSSELAYGEKETEYTSAVKKQVDARITHALDRIMHASAEVLYSMWVAVHEDDTMGEAASATAWLNALTGVQAAAVRCEAYVKDDIKMCQFNIDFNFPPEDPRSPDLRVTANLRYYLP